MKFSFVKKLSIELLSFQFSEGNLASDETRVRQLLTVPEDDLYATQDEGAELNLCISNVLQQNAMASIKHRSLPENAKAIAVDNDAAAIGASVDRKMDFF